MGQLWSMMMQHQSEFALALVINREQWPEGIGCFSNGPRRALYFFLNISIHISGKFSSRFMIALLII